jgi:glucosyl-3-phosphoglycerate phosphatase
MSGRRLLIWRHGRTEWNATGRMQGQSDVALDETGIRQAHEAAPLLAAEQPDAIVSSDLTRARVTAEALAGLLRLPVALDKRLRETYFGPWQGMTSEEIAAAYPHEFAAWTRGEHFSIAGAEKHAEVATRMVAGIEDALDATDGTLVVVTHGAAARRAVGALLGWPDEVVGKLGPLGNCRWTELRHTATGWRLHTHNAGPLAGAAGPRTPTAAADVEPPAAEYLTPAPTHH